MRYRNASPLGLKYAMLEFPLRVRSCPECHPTTATPGSNEVIINVEHYKERVLRGRLVRSDSLLQWKLEVRRSQPQL